MFWNVCSSVLELLMISFAEKALHSINKEERDISTMTLSSDSKGVEFNKIRMMQCQADFVNNANNVVVSFEGTIFSRYNIKS